jgi:hypothetical protein
MFRLLQTSTGAMHVAVRDSAPGGQRLTLVARECVRIGARLTPALELPNGEVIHFAADSVSPDLAYFHTVPAAILPGRDTAVHGVLRTGICDDLERICRNIVLEQ